MPIRPRWVPVLAAVLGIVLTASAGVWQLRRAHFKEALQQQYERAVLAAPIRLSGERVAADELLHKKIAVRGTFVPQAMVLLDNRIVEGVAGYEVVMPLRISGSDVHMLVNRGWLPAGGRRERLPEIRTPDTVVEVIGMAGEPGRFFELGPTDESALVWQNLTIERFVRSRKIAVLPVVLEQSNASEHGLRRKTTATDFGVSKHVGYAVQWFSFCALIVFVFLFFHVRKTRSGQNTQDADTAGRG